VLSVRSPGRPGAGCAFGRKLLGRYSKEIAFFHEGLTGARRLGSMRSRIDHRF